jgi:drug/metabolite transporter (DMT)-like permease
MTALFALSSSLLWGAADFGGGLLTRRLPALVVVVASQAAAALALLVAVSATGGFDTGSPRLLYAVGAGLIGPVAMIAFYRALALGPMGVVSPLATVGVAVPVGVGLALGEHPGALQAAGIAVAAVGVVLRAARREPGAYRPAELTGAGGRVFAGLAAVGLGDVAANGMFVLASRSGSMAVASVLASLYPVVTALCARTLLGERLRPVQAAGSGLALAGAILLAAH